MSLAAIMHEGRPYCRRDHIRLFGPRCELSTCRQPVVEGSGISAFGKRWHEGHFRCSLCCCAFAPLHRVYHVEAEYICQSCMRCFFVNGACTDASADVCVPSSSISLSALAGKVVTDVTDQTFLPSTGGRAAVPDSAYYRAQHRQIVCKVAHLMLKSDTLVQLRFTGPKLSTLLGITLASVNDRSVLKEVTARTGMACEVAPLTIARGGPPLRLGSLLLKVNSCCVLRMGHARTMALLAETQWPLTLEFRAPPQMSGEMLMLRDGASSRKWQKRWFKLHEGKFEWYNPSRGASKVPDAQNTASPGTNNTSSIALECCRIEWRPDSQQKSGVLVVEKDQSARLQLTTDAWPTMLQWAGVLYYAVAIANGGVNDIGLDLGAGTLVPEHNNNGL